MLLRLTTIVAAFLAWAPVAQAWTWPVEGPVLQAFSFDEAHPYAAGQHRGIDIGAAAAGDAVVAPASGTISFAGSVPTSGRTVTIETSDGYSVTLTHLGSIAVAPGATVAEGAVVGTVGPSGAPEQPGPYVHLGIRVSADANGYVDPLDLLPPLAPPPPSPTGSSSGSHSGRSATTGGHGLVIRARPRARPSALPRQAPAASDSAPAEPAAPRSASSAATAHHATRASHRGEKSRARAQAQEPATVATAPSLVHYAAPPAEAGTAPATVPLPRPAQTPLQLGLAAGPGALAGLAAIATALVRRRRRRRGGDTTAVVRVLHPENGRRTMRRVA
jgi:pyruvate/2-oxoglutarate dehydrogenase complex dihydrolipoamide acyltransferase (E2) component